MRETKTAWTPGPWHAWRNTSFWQIDAEEFGQIGDACSSSCNPEFGGSEALGEANAKMMAAAPALYEALSAMVATYCVESSTGPVIEAARSALLLAHTGGTENG